MMMNLSSHVAEFNITVNSVSPAMVGSTSMILDEKSVPGLVDTTPLGRLYKPSEVANVVGMFAYMGFVTGQSLVGWRVETFMKSILAEMRSLPCNSRLSKRFVDGTCHVHKNTFQAPGKLEDGAVTGKGLAYFVLQQTCSFSSSVDRI